MLTGAMAVGDAEEETWVGLDYPLPAKLTVGRGTALFVAGWAAHPREAVKEVTLALDGSAAAEAMWHSMPRLEVLRSLDRGYRSGFWGMLPVGPLGPGTVRRVGIELVDANGNCGHETLGSFTESALPRAAPHAFPGPEPDPPIAVAMATFNPPETLFRTQVESIRRQTHSNWLCFVSDDGSSPEKREMIEEVLGDDPRFILAPPAARRGFYGNFERALAMVPPEAAYVALADQDDRWDEDKLSSLLVAMTGATLAYSDARIVDREGRAIAPTYWGGRRNESDDLLSLLVANCVTGAASLFRSELLEYILPFPPAQFSHFHDHWIALVARSLGEIRYVGRPLYDYTQHDEAVLGHEAATSMPTFSGRLRALVADPRARVRIWRAHYFVDAMRLSQFATVLLLRCSDCMSGEARQTLARFLRTDNSWRELARLSLRGTRELAGRPATLGAEWMLARAFGWRRLVGASVAARATPGSSLRLDAMPPLVLDPKPGELHQGPGPGPAAEIIAKITPLGFRADPGEPQRINVLIPTIDLAHFFGGYIAKFNLAVALARRGRRVRIVTVDPVPALPPKWRERLASFAGLDELNERVEIVFGREAREIFVSPSDSFIATTWWTAYTADAALATTGGGRFLYLIQEYEPGTFPLGSYSALAEASYQFPHHAVFSSELLKGFFEKRSLGVFSSPGGDERSLSFQNAITAVKPPSAGMMASRGTRRLLFYARPEAHAARNMFELGILGLSRALGEGAFSGSWEFHGIGSIGGSDRLALGYGHHLLLSPRANQNRYGATLGSHDVGLALMYTPHPSLVPIEMASAGLVTVTNTFENKTEDAMTAISPNILTGAPSVAGIASALANASTRSGDFDARISGSKVNWSSSWAETFDDDFLERVESLLSG